MKDFQQIAYQHPCYEAEETLDPRFTRSGYVDARYYISVIFTANIGEE